jgi:hypothetical protein
MKNKVNDGSILEKKPSDSSESIAFKTEYELMPYITVIESTSSEPQVVNLQGATVTLKVSSQVQC